MRSRGRQKGGSRHGPESEYTIQKSICELLDLKAPWLLVLCISWRCQDQHCRSQEDESHRLQEGLSRSVLL